MWEMALAMSLIIKFGVHDTFLSDPPAATELYEATGRYVRVWGMLESNFNATLLALLHHPEVREIWNEERERGGPISFKKRIALWRRLVKAPTFASIKENALDFARILGDANIDRNDLLHKGWQDFVDSEKLSFEATSWRFEDGRIRSQVRIFELNEIKDMTKRANALIGYLATITVSVVAAYPQPPDTPRSPTISPGAN